MTVRSAARPRRGKVSAESAVHDFQGDTRIAEPGRRGRRIGGSYVAAATTLRWGFVENGYIAEMLCGMRRPPPLMIWAGTNMADRDTAEAYVDAGGDLWWTTPGAIEFLRWLHMHPKVLEERARFIECQQELVWLEPGEARSQVVRRLETLEREMGPELSEAIVKARKGRDGNRYCPWAHSQVLGSGRG